MVPETITVAGVGFHNTKAFRRSSRAETSFLLLFTGAAGPLMERGTRDEE
jgi:hypothetical protein